MPQITSCLIILNAGCMGGVECAWVRNIFQQICMGTKIFSRICVWVRNNISQIWSKIFESRSISGIFLILEKNNYRKIKSKSCS